MERRTFIKGSGALGLAAAIGGDLALTRTARAENRIVGSRMANLAAGPNAQPLPTASNDLTAYNGPWTDRETWHVLRRAMFGVPYRQFEAAKALGSMDAIVTKLLEARDLTKVPLPGKPGAWVEEMLIPNRNDQIDQMNKNRLGNLRIQEMRDWWFDLMMKENLSIRERMTLLWTNHFVTGSQTVQVAPYVYTYLETCRRNALGNAKQFVLEISKDPAMLIYLNGNQNYVRGTRSNVNENYARELLELFTLGITDPKTGAPNYTETDVQQAAKALTGWKPTTTAPYVGQFDATLHDNSLKTFLGQTGAFGLQEIIDILFTGDNAYKTCYFLSSKIYQALVYYVPNAGVVDAMTNLMISSGFEIAPVVEALLKSAHFYDENVRGSMLKSPIDYAGSLVREFALTYPPFDPSDPPIASSDSSGLNTYKDPNITLTMITETIANAGGGQELLNPPNVKGWPGGHNWISTGTFQSRENYSSAILNNLFTNTKQGIKLTFDPTKYAEQLPVAPDMKGADLAKALEEISISFVFGPLEGGDLNTNIHGTYPEPNYQFNTPGVKNFALYLASLPEFQLY